MTYNFQVLTQYEKFGETFRTKRGERAEDLFGSAVTARIHSSQSESALVQIFFWSQHSDGYTIPTLVMDEAGRLKFWGRFATNLYPSLVGCTSPANDIVWQTIREGLMELGIDLVQRFDKKPRYPMPAPALYSGSREAYFFEQIAASIDIEAIIADCRKNAGWEDSYDFDETVRGETCIGTVFDLMPSGKFFTAWASGNVTDVEESRDEDYRSALNDFADAHGLYCANGENDPCDLFFGRTFEGDSADPKDQAVWVKHYPIQGVVTMNKGRTYEEIMALDLPDEVRYVVPNDEELGLLTERMARYAAWMAGNATEVRGWDEDEECTVIWYSYPMDEMPADCVLTNDQRAQMEIFQFLSESPLDYTAYYDPEGSRKNIVTNWTGIPLGLVVNSEGSVITVAAYNGLTYKATIVSDPDSDLIEMEVIDDGADD